MNAVTVSVIETSPYTERSGYTFAGWFRDASHTQEVEFPFYPDANMTLYALWKYDGLKFSINSQAMIDGVTGIPEDGLLEIPDTVNGVKVKGISAYAFRYNTQIREVKIADAIPFYGVGCFWGCTSLVKVTLPDTVRSIPSDMFYGCSSLREMNFPSALQVIEYDAFWGTAFTAIVLPDSVTDIWNYAFKNCANLSSIDLGGVVSLGDGVFAGCSQLTSIAFPDTIRDLSGNFMFDGCTQLTQITFPAVPVALEYSFLDGTGYYNDASNWQDGVLYLNRHLITIGRDFTEKTEYTVKDGTICIANHAFNGAGIAPKVKKITLPDSMLAIGEGAFSRCNLLAQTNIPSGVRFVGKDAYEGTALYQSGKTNYLDNWLLSYVPQGNETTLVIRDGTIGIAEGKLLSSGASSVTEILLPETLKVIGESNFESMTVLMSVHLPKGLERIGKNAFRYCYALSDFDLSVCTSLKTIGDYAFSFCKAMTRFYIPASVEELGEGVFNQIPNVSVDFEIEQSQIPAGWSKNWDFTYADVPVIAHWGVKNSASEETV